MGTLGDRSPLRFGSVVFHPSAGSIPEDADDSQYDAVINSVTQAFTTDQAEHPLASPTPALDAHITPNAGQLTSQVSATDIEEPSTMVDEIHSILTLEELPDWGEYPHPSTVINDHEAADDLESSGILAELISLDYKFITVCLIWVI